MHEILRYFNLVKRTKNSVPDLIKILRVFTPFQKKIIWTRHVKTGSKKKL